MHFQGVRGAAVCMQILRLRYPGVSGHDLQIGAIESQHAVGTCRVANLPLLAMITSLKRAAWTQCVSRCMAKYDYQQYRCAKEVEALVRCCQSLPNAAGSLHCQGFTHLIKQQGSGPGG